MPNQLVLHPDQVIFQGKYFLNLSRCDFNNLVANGLRSQDLSWEKKINFLTSSAVAGSNDVSGKLISGGGI